jgi:hypothetical protein
MLYFWISVVLFIAGLITGCTGFGAVLLALPPLTFLMDLQTAVTVVAMVSFPLMLFLLIGLRKDIDFRKVGPLLLGAIPGVPVGVSFLRHLDKSVIHLLLGAILIAYPILSVTWKTSERKSGKIEAYFFGFCAGCLGGAFAASGPPVIIYTSMQQWTKDQIKATLLCFFLLQGLAVLIAYGLVGMITPMALKYSGISLPIIFLGTFFGSILYRSVEDRGYKRLMLILMPLLGFLMIWRGIGLRAFSG